MPKAEVADCPVTVVAASAVTVGVPKAEVPACPVTFTLALAIVDIEPKPEAVWKSCYLYVSVCVYNYGNRTDTRY